MQSAVSRYLNVLDGDNQLLHEKTLYTDSTHRMCNPVTAREPRIPIMLRETPTAPEQLHSVSPEFISSPISIKFFSKTPAALPGELHFIPRQSGKPVASNVALSFNRPFVVRTRRHGREMSCSAYIPPILSQTALNSVVSAKPTSRLSVKRRKNALGVSTDTIRDAKPSAKSGLSRRASIWPLQYASSILSSAESRLPSHLQLVPGKRSELSFSVVPRVSSSRRATL